jgi:hypothetical protein
VATEGSSVCSSNNLCPNTSITSSTRRCNKKKWPDSYGFETAERGKEAQ